MVEYNFYSVSLYKKENVILYVYPGNIESTKICEVSQNGDTNLIIGSDSQCDFVYLNNIANKQVELNYVNHKWSYKNVNPNIPIFINKQSRIQGILNNFDSMFIMGLKIVVMQNKLLIIYPPGSLHSISQKLLSENKNYNVANFNAEENIKDFYNSNDYFSKSPVFFKKYDQYEITLTSPEVKQKNDSSSAMFQLIPSALMSITSLVSAYFTIQSNRSGEVNKESYVTNMLMCVVMVITGIAWPIVEMLASKIRVLMSNRMRVYNYNKYLKRKRKELDQVIATQKNYTRI